jgi:hypothetical protein
MFSITGAFPTPGPLVRHAYSELDLARSGTDDQKRALGKPAGLPRPWDPPSCRPALRAQVWAWLDQVAGWINREYIWAPDRFIPSCWPAHPHIAHELAIIADLRRTAGHAFTGDALEEWHRYALPAFLDQAASRLGTSCGPAKHDDWPAAGRYREFGSERAMHSRSELFSRDAAPGVDPGPDLGPGPDAVGPPVQSPPRLVLIDGSTVDTTTGEVLAPPART